MFDPSFEVVIGTYRYLDLWQSRIRFVRQQLRDDAFLIGDPDLVVILIQVDSLTHNLVRRVQLYFMLRKRWG